MATLSIDPARSAVLSMDMQAGIVSIYAKDDPELVTRAAALLKQARQSGTPVIHVKVGFRPGLPEVSSRNPVFGAIKASAQHQKLFEGILGLFIQRFFQRAAISSSRRAVSVRSQVRTWI
jgi:nicotinamidase-related amidase